MNNPRICMPTFSSFAQNAFRCGLYEAQDVLVDCDDVELIHLTPSKGFKFKEKTLIRFIYHDLSGKLSSFNPGLRPVRLKKEYELFLLVCPYWRDILYANAIQGWKENCKTSICWIDELWAKDIHNLRYLLPLINRFDHVILGISGSGKVLSEFIGRPCHEMPGGVDAIRFSPIPFFPSRAIDIYSIGRRIERIHTALLDLTASKGLFYVYDTFQTGNSQVHNYREHRIMYANMAKRSQFFLVAPGKANRLNETGQQEDLGFRFFEGVAAGTIMIGQIPRSDFFYQNFDWPQAVIEIKPDGSDAKDVISGLLAEPDVLHQISYRNTLFGLLRHDWVYRWKHVLSMAGLKPRPALEAREGRLQAMANLTEREFTEKFR